MDIIYILALILLAWYFLGYMFFITLYLIYGDDLDNNLTRSDKIIMFVYTAIGNTIFWAINKMMYKGKE